jgi:hypothetical protein
VDVADFGDREHRCVEADAADLGEGLDALVGLGAALDLARGDLAVEVSDQASVESSRRRDGGRSSSAWRNSRPRGPKVSACGADHSVAGDQGVDAALKRGA